MTWTARQQAFVEAAEAIEPLLDSVTDWSAPGLGSWDVTGLVGHIIRAVGVTITYLEADEPPGPSLGSATAYHETYLNLRASDPDSLDRAIAERSAAEITDTDPDAIRARYTATCRKAIAAVLASDGDRRVATPFGAFRMADYLRTRTLELVAHGVDLSRALGIDAWQPSPAALEDSISLLGALSIARGDGPALLMAMTGRDPSSAAPFPILR